MAIYNIDNNNDEQPDEINYIKMMDENEYEYTNFSCKNIKFHHVVIICMTIVFVSLSIAYVALYFTQNN